jgi:pilus assembly protein TadC
MPVSPSDIFIGDILGFVLALPLSLFMAFWLSAVKRRSAVVLGAFLGALIAFVAIFLWASQLPDANGGATFFGSLFICLIAALVGGILTDLLIARIASHDYRRIAHE